MLGTLPGEESLRRQQYYAHPRNLFWPIVFGLFDEIPPPDYPGRLDFVQRRGIALWDVVAVGSRVASADATISAEIPNSIDTLLNTYPTIRVIAFNGSTARRLYDRHFQRVETLTYFALPSTSPAHARLPLTEKLKQWSILRPVLTGEG
ncbi:MAG: DNA-deoxyinosine glycosylase [Alphaproteobacteria bacterium]|nr:DNA-deoxyinosine glycosylase [Alphaproteobacteria bacterium]